MPGKPRITVAKLVGRAHPTWLPRDCEGGKEQGITLCHSEPFAPCHSEVARGDSVDRPKNLAPLRTGSAKNLHRATASGRELAIR